MRKITPLVCCIFMVAVFSVQAICAEEAVENTRKGIDGVTRPVSDVELSFVQPGKIKYIFVNEGDLVEAGKVLMQQEDEIELIQLNILKGRSGNDLPIRLAKLEYQQKMKDLESIKAAREKGAITQWEVEHAELDVDTALLKVKIREFERDQDKLKLDSISESIKRLSIVSPLDGTVEEIRIEIGETIQALSPVIRIVKKNPLLIDLATPVDLVKKIDVGQPAIVTFDDGEEQRGEVIAISSVADAAATTLEVSIQVENPGERPAGERITVRFE